MSARRHGARAQRARAITWCAFGARARAPQFAALKQRRSSAQAAPEQHASNVQAAPKQRQSTRTRWYQYWFCVQ
eukprot:8387752-Lingulodinium_polyedra.AAC.1